MDQSDIVSSNMVLTMRCVNRTDHVARLTHEVLIHEIPTRRYEQPIVMLGRLF
jgi:hypothetical protein